MLRFFGFVLLLLVDQARAQEVWLRPDKYFYKPGDTAIVRLVSGNNFIGRPLAISSGQTTYTSSLPLLPASANAYRLSVINEGTHSVTLSAETSAVLADTSILRIVKEYGLDEFKLGAAKAAPVDLSHTIFLLLQAGSKREGHFRPANAGALEILLDRNPYQLKKGDPVQFTVLKNGKPAFGVRVRIWNRHQNRTTIQNIYTEKDGTVRTHISSAGDWMVSVLDLKKSDVADSYRGSVFTVVFGYR